MAVLLALTAAYGIFLVYTSVALGWRGLGAGPGTGPSQPPGVRVRRWGERAGLADVRPAELTAVVLLLAAVGAAMAFALFGGVAAPMIAGLFAASFPIASHRARRRKGREHAREAWPRMLEEIRVLTGSAGRSIPQALFDVGQRGPDEMRPAFAAAQREWLISTDFERTLIALKDLLADPTADVVCETLLVAHEVGGADLDRRLAALAEDRLQDLQGRKDASSKQAGVRFARRFVLLVPLGMALAGLSIGSGRSAYQTASGQVGVAFGLVMVVLCWTWAGRLMRLPEEERVFGGGA
jgi:tight adherence protein B